MSEEKCKNCINCGNKCNVSPDSDVNDCIDFNPKLTTIKFPETEKKENDISELNQLKEYISEPEKKKDPWTTEERGYFLAHSAAIKTGALYDMAASIIELQNKLLEIAGEKVDMNADKVMKDADDIVESYIHNMTIELMENVKNTASNKEG